ncbi:MAG: 2-phosphosulfolactate phosphatase [Cyanobacteriota bacterium]
MHIDLLFSPLEELRCNEIKNKTVIVIDVLRACSTITYAFNGYNNEDISVLKGVKEIIPVKNIESALLLFNSLDDKSDYLLAGEINGFKPEGFHLGNSPKDYEVNKIFGKSLIFATTNGTKTLNIFKEANNLLIASFLNAFAVTLKLIALDKDVIIACSGTEDVCGLEDVTCGGLICSNIKDLSMEKNLKINFSDSSIIAMKAYQSFGNVLDIFKQSTHGQRLIKAGFENDLLPCSKINKFNIVPTYYNGKIIPELVKPVSFCSLYY